MQRSFQQAVISIDNKPQGYERFFFEKNQKFQKKVKKPKYPMLIFF